MHAHHGPFPPSLACDNLPVKPECSEHVAAGHSTKEKDRARPDNCKKNGEHEIHSCSICLNPHTLVPLGLDIRHGCEGQRKLILEFVSVSSGETERRRVIK